MAEEIRIRTVSPDADAGKSRLIWSVIAYGLVALGLLALFAEAEAEHATQNVEHLKQLAKDPLEQLRHYDPLAWVRADEDAIHQTAHAKNLLRLTVFAGLLTAVFAGYSILKPQNHRSASSA